MQEIKLKTENIETVKMDTEFINWICPHCNKKNRTIEWVIDSQKLYCMGCNKTVKYSWEKIKI